jgi:hypothetical protein
MGRTPARRSARIRATFLMLTDTSPDFRRCSMLRSISCVLAVGGGSVGLLVLVGGWILGFSPLLSVIPGATSMKVNTALGLIVVASAILLDRGLVMKYTEPSLPRTRIHGRSAPAWKWSACAKMARNFRLKSV